MKYLQYNKYIRKKDIFMITVVLLITVMMFTACTNDDWSSYSEKSYKVSIKLENDICRLDKCSDELKEISKEYSEDLKIVHAKYTFCKNEKSEAVISMSKDYEKNNMGYTVLLEITVDINTNSVTNIVCKDGNSKKISSYSRELDQLNNNYADKIYNEEIELNNKLSKIQISYYSDRININGYDKDGKNIVKSVIK